MNKNTKIVLGTLAVGLLGAGGLFAWNAYTIKNGLKQTQEFRVHSIDLQGITLAGTITFINPTSATVDIEHPAINIYLKGSNNVLAFSAPQNDVWYRINPNSTTIVGDNILITISYLRLAKVINKVIENKELELDIEIATAVRRQFISLPLTKKITEKFVLPTSVGDFLNKIG